MIRCLLITWVFISCQPVSETLDSPVDAPVLNLEQANQLISLPLKCMRKEYPNKLSQTLTDSSDLDVPSTLHPAFYGCFDWHSSVHGHWMLVRLLKEFPNIDRASEARQKLKSSISAENIEAELRYFHRPGEKSFERTYGWAWLLKLAEELHTWNDPLGIELSSNLQPLSEFIVSQYLDFLPKLNYAIRVGEHPNTAFGLAFAWDYAQTTGQHKLQEMIKYRAIGFYQEDKQCPITWEPSGYDFLSPCLEEIDIMRRVLEKDMFRQWLKKFMPQLIQSSFDIPPAEVSDRSDGKLVHLDGVNFSRAWCFYGLARNFPEFQHLEQVGHRHLNYSLPNIIDGGYEGEHWLATFALYALFEARNTAK